MIWGSGWISSGVNLGVGEGQAADIEAKTHLAWPFRTGLLDLNKAEIGELMALPGVGPKLASRILNERCRIGRFDSAEDLERIRGIGRKTLERIGPLVIAGEGVDRSACEVSSPRRVSRDRRPAPPS